MKKILINATNLHSGGGVQVASSFIYELSLLLCNYESIKVIVLLSTSVRRSLPFNMELDKFERFEEVNTYGIKKPPKLLLELSKQCDLCFTVFGPLYYKLKSNYNLVGFAQPWIIYPDNPLYENMSTLQYIKTKLKFFIQKVYFKQADFLVVEHESVKSGLVRQNFHSEKIQVVHNTVSAPFIDVSIKELLPTIKINEDFIFGYVGRAYEHKNLQVLKFVDDILKSKYGLEIAFLFTLTDDEMDSLGFNSLPNFYTHGVISNLQCPDFYSQINAFIFPSLLECFSAAPLEAMMSSKPIFASDYDFIREIYGDAVYYFNPQDAENIAEVIVNNIYNETELKKRTTLGLNLAQKTFTAKDRAQSYMKLINKIIET